MTTIKLDIADAESIRELLEKFANETTDPSIEANCDLFMDVLNKKMDAA